MRQSRHTRRVAGFSLLEVLVAMFIVAVGILGVVSLQLVSMRNNTSALFRTQANQLAYDIIDRVRANPGGDYAIALADDAPSSPPDCEAAACTQAQMVQYDLAQWFNNLNSATSGLPDADGSIVVGTAVVNGVGVNTITVTVQWDDDFDPTTAAVPATVSTALRN